MTLRPLLALFALCAALPVAAAEAGADRLKADYEAALAVAFPESPALDLRDALLRLQAKPDSVIDLDTATRAAGKEKPQRAAAPAEAGRKKRSEAGESKARPAARSPKKHRGGPRGPIEPMKSNRTKDSTEQHSLMKPYYLDN